MAYAVACGVALASACVTIRSTPTYSDTLLRRRTSVDIVPESRAFEATPSVRGESLAISVTSSETCKTTVTPIYRKTVHVENEIDPDAKNNLRPVYSFVAAAVFIGLGVLMYADAESIASQPTQSGDPRNLASTAVLRKIGMRYEGSMRRTTYIRDGWRDSDLSAILADD